MARKQRLQTQYGLGDYDAHVITLTKNAADYYEAVAAAGADPKKAANWVTVELQSLLSGAKIEIQSCNVSPASLAGLLTLIDTGEISGKIAKEVLVDMFATGNAPGDIVKDKGLSQISDTGEIEAVVKQVIDASPEQVSQFKGGKDKVFGYFVGQVMKATRGKGNPQLVNEILRRELERQEQ